MKNKRIQIILVALLATMSLGASRCDNPVPPEPIAPEIEGSWKWKCAPVVPESSVAENSLVEPLVAPKCNEQVGADSPFIGYVSEHIQFSKDPQAWDASFEFGVCVDKQSGEYKYTYNTVDRDWKLEVYDSSQQLQKTYVVKKLSETALELSDATQRCELSKDPFPVQYAGNHPRPNPPVQISWDLRFDGTPIAWTSTAQWPLIYQMPLQQTRVTNPSPYRVEYAVLHARGDGSEIENYAMVVFIYRSATGERLSLTQAVDVRANVPIVQEFYDSAERATIKLTTILVR